MTISVYEVDSVLPTYVTPSERKFLMTLSNSLVHVGSCQTNREFSTVSTILHAINNAESEDKPAASQQSSAFADSVLEVSTGLPI